MDIVQDVVEEGVLFDAFAILELRAFRAAAGALAVQRRAVRTACYATVSFLKRAALRTHAVVRCILRHPIVAAHALSTIRARRGFVTSGMLLHFAAQPWDQYRPYWTGTACLVVA